MDGIGLVRRVVEDALARGAGAAEGFLISSKTTTIDVKEGVVDTLISGLDEGVGLRLLVEKRLGFAFSSDLSPTALSRLVEEALQEAKVSEPDPYHGFPRPFPQYPEVKAYDPSLRAIPASEKVERAYALEKAARQFDRRVTKVRQAAYRDADYRAWIVNSLGLEVTLAGTLCSASAHVMAEEEGEAETGFEFAFSHFFQELQAEEVGRRAAEMAVRKLGARPLPTGRVDVLLHPAVASDLLDTLASSFTAEAVHKGKSLLAGKIGHRIASEKITLVDDGMSPRGMLSFPCDGEGVPSQRTLLVQAGILEGYLYDSYYAAKDGTTSTGNARRTGYQAPPQLGPSNLFIEPGPFAPETIMSTMGRGFYVVATLGMHTANPISGDFSVGAEGFWVEGGKIAFPARGITLAGNVLELLQNVAGVGDDLRFYGRTGSPTLLVGDLHIGGQ